MKKSVSFVLLFLTISLVKAQYCKNVKHGMAKIYVLNLVGTPTKIDTIVLKINADSSKDMVIVRQDSNTIRNDDKGVEFTGVKVDSDDMCRFKKYHELVLAFEHQDFPKDEIFERIKRIGSESCQ